MHFTIHVHDTGLIREHRLAGRFESSHDSVPVSSEQSRLIERMKADLDTYNVSPENKKYTLENPEKAAPVFALGKFLEGQRYLGQDEIDFSLVDGRISLLRLSEQLPTDAKSINDQVGHLVATYGDIPGTIERPTIANVVREGDSVHFDVLDANSVRKGFCVIFDDGRMTSGAADLMDAA